MVCQVHCSLQKTVNFADIKQNFYNFVRDICAQCFIDHPSVTGDPGKEVEIDESKFGKRKYNRGRQVDDH